MTAALDGIVLSDNMTWVNEHTETPVRERVRTSVTGKLIINHASLQGGARIVCAAFAGDGMFLTRAVVEQLKATRDISGYTGTLTLADGRQKNVRWDHGQQPIQVEPIPLYSDPLPENLLRVILRFMEIIP